jgi:signal transduction histidine kinase
MLLSLSLSIVVALRIDVLPLLWGVLGTYVAIPVAVVAVILRADLARGAIADLVVELGSMPTPARLRESLAHALGDPSLSVAYWSEAATAFVDHDGTILDTQSPQPGMAISILERDGMPLAAITHDVTLLDDPGLVASLASAMRLAVENERLHAQVEAQLEEVQASRTRIVNAADDERRRLERDLHDGAQQRLVSLALALRLTKTRLGAEADETVIAELDRASEMARDALNELRDLARGIHPQVLTQAGLGPAIDSLAARSPVTVTVLTQLDGRLPASVESAAYFVVSEALANVAKHARATAAQVRVMSEHGWLHVEISDDGAGGAGPATGSGLRGLDDRVAAIGGTLSINSPAHGGTTLVARIPFSTPEMQG